MERGAFLAACPVGVVMFVGLDWEGLIFNKRP